VNISFEDKVALVTGAGSGLGLATAKTFAESGASVALADADEQAVRAAVEDLTARGHNALAIRCDVADDAEVESMVERTVAAFGRLDAPTTMPASRMSRWKLPSPQGRISTG
jgi:NAD(P)-dependent dehydrogenase (short-subunit alcohol dehydrogenase family)